ncbi:hypothetical protein PV326_004057, partial [Microctonus aethiopoides]
MLGAPCEVVISEVELKVGNLEAFAVNNSWARFIILLLGDPHLLEGGQGSEDGTTDPYGVFPF